MSATPLLRLIQPSITRPGGTRLTTSPASTVAAAAPKVLDLRSVERQVKGGSAEAFAFGPFRLDEPGRVLTLSDREVALQPRVFDLLAYLVRHRERVVSKDELLDTLWPEVTVTENSLQRAVSTLRSALREGGMDSLLKNYPGKGYRFCSETLAEPTPPSDPIHDEATEPAPHRQAIAEQRWADALSLLSALNEIRALDAVGCRTKTAEQREGRQRDDGEDRDFPQCVEAAEIYQDHVHHIMATAERVSVLQKEPADAVGRIARHHRIGNEG